MTKRPKIGPRSRGSKPRKTNPDRNPSCKRETSRPYPIKKTENENETLHEQGVVAQTNNTTGDIQIETKVESGPMLAEQFKDLSAQKLWGGGKTKKNKNRKTKRYTKRYISKLNKRNKTRKRRNSH